MTNKTEQLLQKRNATLEKELAAKNRELEIEAALEKVRAKTMAMQHSDELAETSFLLFQQFKELGKISDQISVGIFNERENIMELYSTLHGSQWKEAVKVDLSEPVVMKKIHAAWKKKKHSLVIDLEGDQLKKYNIYRKKLSNLNYKEKRWIIQVAFFSKGVLTFSATEPHPKETIQILERFAVVFDGTYARFLDLQKAEVQAREAEIELALERVRARTMAMHQSSELAETALLLFQQLIGLGLSFSRTGFYIWQKETDLVEGWTSNGALDGILPSLLLPFKEDKGHRGIYEASLKGELTYEQVLSGEELKRHYQWLMSQPTAPKTLRKVNESEYDLMQTQYKYAAIFKEGYLLVIAAKPQPDAKDLLIRFAKVFEQTYTRFLDLQKAEEQAREAQIQLALERIRARTMAMQKSDELADVATLLFRQVNDLGIKTWTTGFNIWSDDNNAYEDWIASPAGGFIEPYVIDATAFSEFKALSDAKKSGTEFFILYQEGEILKETYKQLSRFANKNQFEKILEEGFQFPSRQFVHMVFGSKVSLMFITYEPVPEAHDIFKRFGKVFNQTYTRFLDLQKAEAQAREAQIQVSLERLRSRMLRMQKSSELEETTAVMYQQLNNLGVVPEGCLVYIVIIDKNTDTAIQWIVSDETLMRTPETELRVPMTKHPELIKTYEGWKRQEPLLTRDLTGVALEDFKNYIKSLPSVRNDNSEIDQWPDRAVWTEASFSNGLLGMIYTSALPEATSNVLIRFAKVFDLTYTRFLDLQKAEAQTREAEIQLALERVRARTMAMQKPSEFVEVINVIGAQFVNLGFDFDWVNFSANGLDVSKDIDIWNFFVVTGLYQGATRVVIPFFEHPVFKKAEESINQYVTTGNEFSMVLLDKKDKDSFLDHLFTTTIYRDLADEVKLSQYNRDVYLAYSVILKDTWLSLGKYDAKMLTDEEIAILKRLANEFGQAYTRFLDLHKAEAQAREARIEAALERVRSRTMAMQNSDELADLVATVFTELNRLEFALTSCIIWINNPELLSAEMWVASTEMNKPPEPYYIKPFRHPYFKSVIDAWKNKNKKWVYEMKGEEKRIFQQQFFNEVGNFPTLMKNAMGAPESVIYSASFYNFGALEIIGTEQVTDEKFEILHRLGKVFDMSYTRFNDLKQAEAQAREAKIEAALERIRSRTMAMQKSDELAETSAILFRQLIQLGIAPNRLYIGITNDKNTNIEFWITDEEGSKVSSSFIGDAEKNISVMKMYDGWKQQKPSIIIDMHGKELDEYFHYLGDELRVPFQGGLSQKRRIQYISYFTKGFIGLASPDEQPEKTVLLLDRFAAVFNLTFTRFNDLKVAEAHALQAELDLIEIKAARKKAEETLVELQSTQKQLIQSEKMASLGELTAGIAHEIQNPLNFVNNFSEVSAELIDEMKDELSKSNYEEANEIADDLKQNLEKINHHGKRAGDIVKGMLQHSRSSTGVKEPTNINVLVDEYLRLSYQGLRAKDKFFNAEMKTDFDKSIGKINMIPQDIGRVLLNLYNNAFYAVNEKQQAVKQHASTSSAGHSYEPTVSVTTKKSDNHVIITVSDNGNGIPKNIIDKIFQPFFTTKPTGSGTGLGLSLSYDIVKAHGGEIKVETKETEGTTFTINLPIT